MPTPLDPATLPDNVLALRTLLLHREDEHAAELAAAHNGLKEQVLRNEQLKLRLAKLLRERFGASSEKLRGAIEQLELVLEDLEEKIAETAPAETAEPVVPPETEALRRKPARKPLPETLPRDVVEHAAPCACPKSGGSLRPLGEDVSEVLEYVPGSFRVTRLCGQSCHAGRARASRKPWPRVCRSIAGWLDPAFWRMCWWRNTATTSRCIAKPRSTPATASTSIARRWRTGWDRRRD
jgi:Transposase C of IS166 homeodomain/zinc-finger binding domain of transposase IS66